MRIVRRIAQLLRIVVQSLWVTFLMVGLAFFAPPVIVVQGLLRLRNSRLFYKFIGFLFSIFGH